MDPDLQKNEQNTDRDTDFKTLMLKLKIDNDKYTTLADGPIVSVIYRLNGVKVSGNDLEVRVCDFIEMKKEERREHERDVARLKSATSESDAAQQKQQQQAQQNQAQAQAQAQQAQNGVTISK